MSTNLNFFIQPQRATGRGWLVCEPHRAQKWAVVKQLRVNHRHKRFHREQVLERWDDKRMAEVRRDELARAAKPLPKPTLGQRFARTGREIIARSLSYEQYHGRSK